MSQATEKMSQAADRDSSSCECLAFDISQEFLHGDKAAAVDMLRKATESYDYNLIMSEIKAHGWFDWNDLHEFYHACIHSYDR